MPGSWCFQEKKKKTPSYFSEFLGITEKGTNKLEWVDLLGSS